MKLFSFLVFFFLVEQIEGFPCPAECFCRAVDDQQLDHFVRISYLIDCSNSSFPTDRFRFSADLSSINEFRIGEDRDDPSNKFYVISIDLSDSSSLANFAQNSVEIDGFPFVLTNLSLTSVNQSFSIATNAFAANIFKHLKHLNLSSCCRKVPLDCHKLFSPLKNLVSIDLSGSNLYQFCLNDSGSMAESLSEISLRDNEFDEFSFSRSSRFFDGVRKLSGRLDLRNSRFKVTIDHQIRCLFEVFPRLTSLDLSNIKVESRRVGKEIFLERFVNCGKSQLENELGRRLISISLANLELKTVPIWLNSERFLSLRNVDLSGNEIRQIDLTVLQRISTISLASNPIELENSNFLRSSFDSIDLRSMKSIDSSSLEFFANRTSTLDFSGNRLAHFPVGRNVFPKISSIFLSENGLDSFDLFFPELRTLDVSKNQLKELNLEQFAHLENLKCSKQNLESLKLNKNLKNLRTIFCAENFLLTVENLVEIETEHLEHVDLSQNRIFELNSIFSKLSSRVLKIVELGRNQIEFVPSNSFSSNLIALWKLDLSSNRIEIIESNAIRCFNLQILDLTGNPLRKIEPNGILTPSLRIFSLTEENSTFRLSCPQTENFGPKIHRKFCTAKKLRFSLAAKISASVGALFLLLLIVFIVFRIKKKKQISVRSFFRPYRKIEQTQLIEDDEIVMNLDEAPFPPNQFSPTRV